ncbi:MAG: hypothetical protein U0176_12265 [Bacteroidia bacterium]
MEGLWEDGQALTKRYDEETNLRCQVVLTSAGPYEAIPRGHFKLEYGA